MMKIKEKEMNQENQSELEVSKTDNKHNNQNLNISQSILSSLSPQSLRECFVGTAVIIGLMGTFPLATIDKDAKSQFINITNVFMGTYIGILIPRDSKK